MKTHNPPMCTGGSPAPYPFPVSSMLGGGLWRSQERVLSMFSHLSSSALSSSQSESPLQTKDLLMHWPAHEESRHTNMKEGRKEPPPGIGKVCLQPPAHTGLLTWIWPKSSGCPGENWWLFSSSFCNTQNWLSPWPDTKSKIKPEFPFQAFPHEQQAVCLNPPKSYSANHWEASVTSCPSTLGFSSGIPDKSGSSWWCGCASFESTGTEPKVQTPCFFSTYSVQDSLWVWGYRYE